MLPPPRARVSLLVLLGTGEHRRTFPRAPASLLGERLPWVVAPAVAAAVTPLDEGHSLSPSAPPQWPP